jgi:hypothetical protein
MLSAPSLHPPSPHDLFISTGLGYLGSSPVPAAISTETIHTYTPNNQQSLHLCSRISVSYLVRTVLCITCGKLTPLGNLHTVVVAQADRNILKSRYQFTNKRW